ncbi:MAG: c-type cytochrome [Myxococcales bacterium]|nr:c-type cytochrome [Myxococcales bacterium]
MPLPHLALFARRKRRIGTVTARHGPARDARRRRLGRGRLQALSSGDHRARVDRMSLRAFLDDRTGYKKLVAAMLDEPVHGGARWAYVWGSALTLSLVVQAVTGLLLMTAYQPSATTAWSSVMYVSYELRAGWLVRALHHYGAQAMIVLLAAHLGQTAWYGAYKKPRELNWLLGLAPMGITLALALTGYLLPWDQKGYWATRVATNIAGSVPAIGPALQRLLLGGDDYGHLTLTRFYALHVGLLPFLLFVVLAAHIALFRRHGVTAPERADPARTEPFYPRQLWRDLLVSLGVLVVLFALAARHHGAPLDGPADPASDYPARPEWYFLALFELLKFVPGRLEWVAAVILPLLLGGYLCALPFIDRGPSRSIKSRAIVLAPLGLTAIVGALLTWLSLAADAKDPGFQAARVRTEQRTARAIELGRRGVPPEGPLAMLAADPDSRGPELFAKHCASCHRLHALGPPPGESTAPNLEGFGTERFVLAMLDTPDAPERFGNTPFKGMMDSFTTPPADPALAEGFVPMPKADREAIAQFLAAEARGGRVAGSRGETLVKNHCTQCHRLDGKAPLDESSLAPELGGWGSPAWTLAHLKNPGSGATYPSGAMAKELEGHMPAFATELSNAELGLLTTWLLKEAARPE